MPKEDISNTRYVGLEECNWKVGFMSSDRESLYFRWLGAVQVLKLSNDSVPKGPCIRLQGLCLLREFNWVPTQETEASKLLI
jgi:hypothetical protein